MIAEGSTSCPSVVFCADFKMLSFENSQKWASAASTCTKDGNGQLAYSFLEYRRPGSFIPERLICSIHIEFKMCRLPLQPRCSLAAGL
jgi:hypothetical protein